METSWRYIKTVSRDYILIPNNSISRDTLVNYNRPIPYPRQKGCREQSLGQISSDFHGMNPCFLSMLLVRAF
ncbi:hypothetical protein DPF_0721 [Desulfoplanes formicivorans]|uniref:Uncharacterized protein n=2 Tax=Desulfoplanes formicivorans TaxID=1592317 RepID=A0A194AFP0_9BACT|nr:hypothetical protein [Desulfoplanes formicivorans]GAU08020.1 hypothetical protein DPF_0721 [Desulfoplanes formicivorans]